MEHGHGHHLDDASVADLLDLDAEVLGAYLDELTDWVRGHVAATPRSIIDIGAGTGAGTVALARRFDQAHLIAIDRSQTMLNRLHTAAEAQGIATRLRTVRADLDTAWPETGTADLAWAASSLHHVADPDRVLADVHAALNPGGLLVVVEMDAMPRFLPEDLGIGRPDLEERCRQAAADNGWNVWPNWTDHLKRVGFAAVEQRTLDLDVHPVPPAANRYAHQVLNGMRSRLADRLQPDDIAVLDQLLDPGSDEFVLHRRDLRVRSTRTAWAARRGSA
jgi:ubiquinone/menaquinone biosynthesis C-methylase UbiE